MQNIDVFNGDADGICALIQLRRANPKQSKLITGIKRDINLLSRINNVNKGDCLTVLDISFEKNATDVSRLLHQGASIYYIDHHKTGELIEHNDLYIDIDLSANTCTSLIVDKQLQGRYRAWAITAAFGDNLSKVATTLGLESGFSTIELETLRKLGILLNYNGYGADIEDLFFHPATLFEKCQVFDTPFDFLVQDELTFQILVEGYEHDMFLAKQAPVIFETSQLAIIQLPNEKWARRVSGVLGNDLANTYPDRAHAVLTKKEDDSYLVSVRAPLNRKFGADELVSQFPTGGGRKAAAGINRLPTTMLEQFIKAFKVQFSI